MRGRWLMQTVVALGVPFAGLRGAGKGALWGAGTMAVLFAVVPVRECRVRSGETSCDDLGLGESMAIGAFGGAFWGAVIGTAIGSERWERATLPASVGLAPAPDGRGVQLGVRIAYSP